jgi:hypothetical protein
MCAPERSQDARLTVESLERLAADTREWMSRTTRMPSRSETWRRVEIVDVVAEPPADIAVVFRVDGRLFGWRYPVLDDEDQDSDPTIGASHVIDANVEELIDTGELAAAPPPDDAGISWLE